MKFGLAHPIYNNRYNKLKIIETTAKSLTYPNLHVDLFDGGALNWNRNFMSDSDGAFGRQVQEAGLVQKVIIGPSTHASNTGETRVYDITLSNNSSVIPSSSGIVLIEPNGIDDIQITIGDPVTFLVGGLPDGWTGYAYGATTSSFIWGSTIDDGGYCGPYGFNILDVDPTDNNCIANIPLRNLQANTWYRLGVMYKMEGVTSYTEKIRLSIYRAHLPVEELMGHTYTSSGPDVRAGSVSGFTDAGGGYTTCAAVTSGLTEGDSVLIVNSTNYNGWHIISSLTGASFDIPVTHVTNPGENGAFGYFPPVGGKGNSFLDFDQSTSWTETSTMFKTPENMDWYKDYTPEPYMQLYIPDNAEMDAFRIAGISLMSSPQAAEEMYTGTSGDGYSGENRGFTEVIDYISGGSLKIKREHNNKPTFDIDRNYYLKNTRKLQDLPCPNYVISFKLGHVSDTVAKEIMRLFEWQNKGYLINLHPDITGLPYCLTGQFTQNTRTTVNILDLTESTFTLEFREVIL